MVAETKGGGGEGEVDKEGECVCVLVRCYPCDVVTVALVSTARRACEFNHDQHDKCLQSL